MLPTTARGIRAAVCSLLLLTAAAAEAQAPSSSARPPGPWTFTTRLVLSGSSDEAESDPAGYKVYSAFALDAAVQRKLGSRLAFEASLRTESREVAVRGADGKEAPRGSVEALPLGLILQYRPGAGDRFRPYIGAGVNVTVVWEKAGALDSADLSPSLAPAVQLGADVRVSPRVFLSVDLKWNPWRTDIELDEGTLAHLRIDPLALGIGVGFRF